MTFRDRAHAGRLLAWELERFRAERPIVFGLARGGVLVASEVARHLGAPLEPMVVCKLGAPGCPEFALGAIAEGGAAYINPEALLEVGLSDAEVGALAEREEAELERRVRAYRGASPFPEVSGRTVILVDDGIATGATARAAGRAVRSAGAGRVVLAAPVIAASSAPGLRQEFDDVIAVDVPAQLVAVGLWYDHFGQLSDADVVAVLRRAREAEGEDGDRPVGERTGP